MSQWLDRKVAPIWRWPHVFGKENCGLKKWWSKLCRGHLSPHLVKSFAKAYRPATHIEDVIVQVDIIVQARFCNFQAISRSVWLAISYQMGLRGAQKIHKEKHTIFRDRLQQYSCHWGPRRDIETDLAVKIYTQHHPGLTKN